CGDWGWRPAESRRPGGLPMLPTESRVLPLAHPGAQAMTPNGSGRRGSTTFGADTYNVEAMRETLPRPVLEKLLATIHRGAKLDSKIAEEVAHGMKEWAVARG